MRRGGGLAMNIFTNTLVLAQRSIRYSADIRPFGFLQARRAFGSAAEVIEEDNHDAAGGHGAGKGKGRSKMEEGFKIDLTEAKKAQLDRNWWAKQTKAKWWHPDPVTGVWVPEDKFGEIDTAQLREERRRDSPPASMDERAWWTSLEELPDEYDRSRNKRQS